MQTALKVTFITLIFSAFSINLIAQDTVNVVLITKIKNDKERVLIEGKKITYWKMVDNKKIKGLVGKVIDSGFISSTDTVIYTDLSKISFASSGLKAVKVTGGIIVLAGLGQITLGGLMLAQASGSSNIAEVLILGLFGVIFIGSGSAFTFVGAIPMLFHGKKYDLHGGWKIQTVKAVKVNKRYKLLPHT